MTYFGFLLRFLVLPIAALALLLTWKARGRSVITLGGQAFWIALAVQILLAVIYTTPWDNYLVAHGVWYYNPSQVSGILLGYVPLEEYTFFVLQAILVGLWWQFLAPRLPALKRLHPSTKIRLWACTMVLIIWLGSLVVLLSGWKPGTYLGLILIWALPPIAIQLAFGADILWQRRTLLAALILVPGLYLSVADSLAIQQGIWAIDPAQSTGIFIGGLPLEEGLFFFITVILIAFGMTLSLAMESQTRLVTLRRKLPESVGSMR